MEQEVAGTLTTEFDLKKREDPECLQKHLESIEYEDGDVKQHLLGRYVNELPVKNEQEDNEESEDDLEDVTDPRNTGKKRKNKATKRQGKNKKLCTPQEHATANTRPGQVVEEGPSAAMKDRAKAVGMVRHGLEKKYAPIGALPDILRQIRRAVPKGGKVPKFIEISHPEIRGPEDFQ